MQEVTLTRVVQLPSRGQITLPTDFRRKLGLVEGDLLQMTLVGEKIEIQPVRTADARLRQYTEAEVE
ncbi:MAG: AbrB/MazE/SpoVT family DNA-binding domain-containing protein [Chloroflexi bacterium]|nr:AbrB/MazE/SpoVT family DNA-binding domain-containing protein [Chloroflexota bacterium]